jgi:hypothetical protein
MAMTSPSAAQVERAKRMLAHEGDVGRSSEECAAAAWRVYEKLNARLAPRNLSTRMRQRWFEFSEPPRRRTTSASVD